MNVMDIKDVYMIECENEKAELEARLDQEICYETDGTTNLIVAESRISYNKDFAMSPENFSSIENSTAFVKAIRSEKASWLRQNYPWAYLLLGVIAERARRHSGHFDGLIIGDALIGDYTECGIPSRKIYRTAVDKLVEFRLIEIVHNGKKYLVDRKTAIKTAIRGTLVNIKDRSIYDINPEDEGQQKGQSRANKGPTRGHEQEGIRKNKKEEEEHTHPSGGGVGASSNNYFTSLEQQQNPQEINNSSFRSPIMYTKFPETIDSETQKLQQENHKSDNVHNVVQNNFEEPPPKKSKKRSEKKEKEPDKIKFRENILLTEKELEQLYAIHGKEDTEGLLDNFNSYKSGSGRKYKNDFDMLKSEHNWPFIKYSEEKVRLQELKARQERLKLAVHRKDSSLATPGDLKEDKFEWRTI